MRLALSRENFLNALCRPRQIVLVDHSAKGLTFDLLRCVTQKRLDRRADVEDLAVFIERIDDFTQILYQLPVFLFAFFERLLRLLPFGDVPQHAFDSIRLSIFSESDVRAHRSLYHASVFRLELELIVVDGSCFLQLLNKGFPVVRLKIKIRHRMTDDIFWVIPCMNANRGTDESDPSFLIRLVVHVVEGLEDGPVFFFSLLLGGFCLLRLRDVSHNTLHRDDFSVFSYGSNIYFCGNDFAFGIQLVDL